MRELLAELNRALERGRDCVYCSVVETRGSTPQKAGAAMLVFADGNQAGTLGGGCVEAEVKRNALLLLSGNGDAKPTISTFCLDDNYGWDDGLICGGRMTILADPLSSSRAQPARDYYRTFRRFVDEGIGCTEAIVTADNAGAPVGTRFLLDDTGQVIENLGADELPPVVLRHLVPLGQRPRAYLKDAIAYLPNLPRITLLIVGAGHVGQAVAKLAADVDFDIWVLDDRETYASTARFPTAQRRIVGDIGVQLGQLQAEINPSTYALIVTRGHGHDEEALFHLATTQAGYVGMIGSKRKIRLIFEDLLARNIPKEALDRVHAPLGFSIGSQTVPEIAVSIVAELIACRNLGQTIPEAREWVKV